LEALPEVEGVAGAGNITVLKNDITGYYPLDLTDGSFTADEIKQELSNLPVIKEQLFADDYKTARFIVTLKQLKDFDQRRGEIIEKVQNTVGEYVSPHKVFFGGIGVIYTGLNKLSQADFGFFLGVGYLAMFIMLLITYRKFLVLVYALGTVALSTYITLGIYGLCGFQLNIMTTLLPVIFVLLGIMDITHILNEQSILSSQELSQKDIALQSLLRMFKPGFFNSATTMAGFLALLTSPMAILQSFGLFAAIGILLCFVFTYLLGIIILPATTISPKISINIGDKLTGVLLHVLKYKRRYTVICIAFVLVSLVGISRLKSDTYTLGYFPEKDKVVQDHQQMEKLWGPYLPLDFLVEANEGVQFYSPSFVKEAIAFSDTVKRIEGIESSFGFHSLYIAGLQQFDSKRFQVYLRSKSALKTTDEKLKIHYPELVSHYINNSTKTARMIVFGRMATAAELTTKLDTLQKYANATMGKYAKVHPSGYQPLYSGIVQYVTQSQVYSLFTAAVFIFLLIWLFIGNLKLSLIAVVSNFFPVIAMLGIMGLNGIYLDTATASIAAIVLSICVDDTVHYIYHYRGLRKEGFTPGEARMKTSRHIGPAIIITGLLLFSGYSFMMLGQLQTVRLFGLLTAIAIVVGIFGELVLFPLMLERFDTSSERC
jgi:predicted RND superfamily exporter protein